MGQRLRALFNTGLITVTLALLAGCTTTGVPSFYSADATRNGSGQALLPDGSTFTGNFRQGLFHGQGEIVHANGDRYVGEFFKGLSHGQGTFESKSNWSYSGEFNAGNFNGTGTLKLQNDDQYTGQFSAGLMHGTGTFETAYNKRYIGEFADDTTSGRGKIEYPGGGTYEGEWSEWEPWGEGVYTSKDGDTYSGEFEQGEPVGSIDIKYVSGTRYSGEIKNWLWHGEGVLKSENGNVYTGGFSKQAYSGVGSLQQANGTNYEGEFRRGDYHGDGTLVWPTATGEQSLTGPWRRGKYQGPDKANYLEAGLSTPDAEQLQFHQQRLLDAALKRVTPGTPEVTDIYALTFAGHGRQDVFRKESMLAEQVIKEQFQTKGSLALVNHPTSTLEQPLATGVNLEYALQKLSRKMDTANDVLMLFLTSHGGKDHSLSVNLPGKHFESLGPDALANMLDEADIKWRVVVVSACYSGGFVAPLKNDHTIVISSSRADRTSFGCSDDADLTFFGRAFWEQSTPGLVNYEAAFYNAKELIAVREKAAGYEPSEPQIHVGDAIRAKLAETARKQSKPSFAKTLH